MSNNVINLWYNAYTVLLVYVFTDTVGQLHNLGTYRSTFIDQHQCLAIVYGCMP